MEGEQSDGRLLYIGVATSDTDVSESRPWRVWEGALRFERNRRKNMAVRNREGVNI